jgi:hypothetical protein
VLLSSHDLPEWAHSGDLAFHSARRDGLMPRLGKHFPEQNSSLLFIYQLVHPFSRILLVENTHSCAEQEGLCRVSTISFHCSLRRGCLLGNPTFVAFAC